MKRHLLLFMMCCLGISIFAQTVITDASINAGESLTLTNDQEWLMDGLVYVEEGATLTIEPGTVIKSKIAPTTGDNATALIITRGAKIMAEGTADAPIIFTAELDDVNDPTDLTAFDREQWGGIVILGNSIVGVNGGEERVEGIPSTEVRIVYGGDDPADNSGILKYVSIRHAGIDLESDNELNGLTLGGVGSGTVIDYVEVFANKDDGIEFFGGTVNVTHLVVGFVGDDSYDFDMSYNGYLQYVLAVQGEADGQGDNAIEYDGSEEADKDPNEFGRIYNGTFIGPGATAANSKGNGLTLKVDGKAQIWNSIFVDQKGPVYIMEGAAAAAIANNIVFGNGAAIAVDNIADPFLIEEIDPQLGGISRMTNGGLDPRPNADSPANSGAAATPDEADLVGYRGAFNNRTNWAAGWTALSEQGYFGDLATTASNVITDASINAGETLTLTADTEWILDGFVYAEEGATLIIEPGTVIKSKITPTTGDNATALIITKGARILAEGTADAPIIFTAEIDDVNDPTDLTAFDREQWGGIVILGNSIVGVNGGEEKIEGIPSTETRTAYGGNDPADNSGILKYVSIRHAGIDLESDNELNGLTLGGVGSGTVIDYVEVFANKDDGIEFFGGTVNATHLVVGFVGDDSYDFDMSYNGYLQYVLAVQGEADGQGDNAIEYDGSEEADKDPNEFGRIYNGTFIGPGATAANSKGNGLTLKVDGKAQIWNSIFVDQKGPVYIMEGAAAAAIANNYVFGNGAAIAVDNIADPYIITEADPQLRGISRTTDGGLNPLPQEGSPVLTAAAATPDEAAAASFVGAFQFENWAFGWTALTEQGYFSDMNVSTVDFGQTADGMVLNVPTPNPVRTSQATLTFELPTSAAARLTVFDMAGRVMDQIDLGQQNAGANQHQLKVGNYHNGTFVMVLMTDNGAVSQKFTVAK